MSVVISVVNNPSECYHPEFRDIVQTRITAQSVGWNVSKTLLLSFEHTNKEISYDFQNSLKEIEFEFDDQVCLKSSEHKFAKEMNDSLF